MISYVFNVSTNSNNNIHIPPQLSIYLISKPDVERLADVREVLGNNGYGNPMSEQFQSIHEKHTSESQSE